MVISAGEKNIAGKELGSAGVYAGVCAREYMSTIVTTMVRKDLINI